MCKARCIIYQECANRILCTRVLACMPRARLGPGGRFDRPLDAKQLPGSFTGFFNRNGERHGEGTMTYTDGSIDAGPWLNGLLHPDEALRRKRLAAACAEKDKLERLLHDDVVTGATADAAKMAVVEAICSHQQAVQEYIDSTAANPTPDGLLQVRPLPRSGARAVVADLVGCLFPVAPGARAACNCCRSPRVRA
jgi:hypothetical protein